MILANKKVLISGSSRGLGKALKHKFSKGGAEVIELTRKNCDLSDSNQIYSFVENLGHIDILVNCAGVFPLGSLQETSFEVYQQCMQINLTAPFILSKELSKGMMDRGWGRIINIGSSSAYAGSPKTSVYCASKHALLGLSRSLFKELKEYGVRVIYISPGSIKTDMGKEVEKLGQDFSTFIEPEELADYIVYTTCLNGNMIAEEVRLNRMFIQ